MPARVDGAALHRDALIIDGLNFFSDGNPASLRAANIAAVNMTVSHMESDFEATSDQIAEWIVRLRDPNSGWHLIERAADIDTARAEGKVGLIMGWQNMRPISDKLDRLALVHKLGLRVMQPTYNLRNFMGDGCLEPVDGGLSALGVSAVRLANELGIALDFSHVGERTTLDAAEVTAKPILVTHANAKAVRDAPRNKSDAALRAVAATGGTIGVSIYGPMCWDGDPDRQPDLGDFLRHLDHIVSVAGIDHVAIGTDLPAVENLHLVAHITEMTRDRFPAAIEAYARAFGNDIRGRYLRDCGSSADLVKITMALVERGWPEADIRGLLGLNLRRALQAIWGG